jgi:hypothetical protein
MRRFPRRPAYNSHMDAQTGRILAPPDALRPAQLGVVLNGRVLPIHIGATVVDLANRGFLSMQIAADDGSSWRLTILDRRPEDLLDYERALLHGLFGRQPTIPLEHLAVWAVPVLEKVRSGIVRDALDRGWLRSGLGRRFAVTRGQRRRHDQNPGKRTKPGEELLKDIKAFKRELRALADAGDTRTLTRFACYAMIFGLAAPVPTASSAPGESYEADPPVQTAAFAASWLEACGAARNSGPGPMWQWDSSSADHTSPHGHGHGGYPGHSGGHGGFGGGHGGGFDGGHGGGFGGHG